MFDRDNSPIIGGYWGINRCFSMGGVVMGLLGWLIFSSIGIIAGEAIVLVVAFFAVKGANEFERNMKLVGWNIRLIIFNVSIIAVLVVLKIWLMFR